MPYGKSEDVSKLKKKIEEQMPGVDVDNLTQNDMQRLLVNEINKNNSIDPSVKQKINNGDIDGLKEDLINYLSRSKSGDSDKLVKMLKNNDMEGLKNQLMSMLLGSINSQKKNEIVENTEAKTTDNQEALLPLFDNKAVFDTLIGKIFEGNKGDSRVVFLNSMRPFLSEKRQKSLDDCVRILSMISFIEKFMNKVGS